MVRILANGNIVHEDEKSVTSGVNRPGMSSAANSLLSGDGSNRNVQQGTDFLTSANARLAEFGLPTYTFCGISLQPVHFVVIVLSALFFGVQSLLFLGLLFFIFNTSRRNGTSDNRQSNTTSGSSTDTSQTSHSKDSRSFPGRGYSLH